MIDVLRLTGRASILRFEQPQTVAATTPDDGRDGKTAALARLDDVRGRLAVSLTVIDAIDVRINLRPPPPPPQTLQDLVRSGRRRLAEERQRGARRWVEGRATALDRLRAVLEA